MATHLSYAEDMEAGLQNLRYHHLQQSRYLSKHCRSERFPIVSSATSDSLCVCPNLGSWSAWRCVATLLLERNQTLGFTNSHRRSYASSPIAASSA